LDRITKNDGIKSAWGIENSGNIVADTVTQAAAGSQLHSQGRYSRPMSCSNTADPATQSTLC